jgi:hypothetical protein
MIEEMAKDIEKTFDVYRGFCQRKRTECSAINNCLYCNIATHLTKQGYRKIPEGSVVVDKEYLKKELQWLEAQARKETAKEILKEIMSVETEEEKWLKNEPFVRYVKKMLDKIEELAKNYGVEVEE